MNIKTHTHTEKENEGVCVCVSAQKLDILHLVRHGLQRAKLQVYIGVAVERRGQSEELHSLWRHRQSKYFARKKREMKNHSTSCWHTYHALKDTSKYATVAGKCPSQHTHTVTHKHTHMQSYIYKPQHLSSVVARCPHKTCPPVIYLRCVSFFFFGFLTQKTRREQIVGFVEMLILCQI